MKSGAAHHFPPLVFRNGKKILWNRIEKKPLANRPEERVRLRFIDYLTLECGWPSSRIGSEQTIAGRDGTPRLRADLICFDRSFKPSLLIECKAESIPLNQKTAEQIALYNRHVHAPHLCITNGINDFWFETGNRGVRTLARPPLETGAAKPAAGLDYWVARGFAGRNALKHNG
ncbi:MAG: type I restriction enzyme HsdR N-terminal domain-containing protein, partial [Balneolaceae bacterium]